MPVQIESPPSDVSSPSPSLGISRHHVSPHLAIRITQPSPSSSSSFSHSQPTTRPQSRSPQPPSAISSPPGRSKSVSFATMETPSMNQLANHRPSLPWVSLSSARKSQLALLAEQASLASAGTSSLGVARAQSIALEEAVKHAMGNGSSESGTQAKQQGGVGASASASTSPTRDRAWEETVASSDFLSSASSLAEMFHGQEQNRKDWAGQALALQQRRWTVSSGRPSMTLASKSKGKRRAIEGSDTPAADADDRPLSSKPSSPSKKRRLTFADVASGKVKDRRVSFAVKEDDEDRSMESASATLQPSDPPSSLANVLASFETVLDFRQKACAGLAELARRADEMDTFKSPGAPATPAAATGASAPAATASAAATAGGSDASSPASSVFAPSSEEGSPRSSEAVGEVPGTDSARYQ